MSTSSRVQVFVGSLTGALISLIVATLVLSGAQPRTFGVAMVVALAVSFPVAVLVAWVFSTRLAERVRAIARIADRYSSGDLTRPIYDYGSDEIGAVARVLDASVHDLGRRLDELSRERAHMQAILSGMV